MLKVNGYNKESIDNLEITWGIEYLGELNKIICSCGQTIYFPFKLNNKNTKIVRCAYCRIETKV